VPEVKAASKPGLPQRLTVDDQVSVEGGTAVQLIEITFAPGGSQEVGLVVRGSSDGTAGTRIGIRPGSGELIVDRTRSGDTGFHEAFPSTSRAPIAAGQDGSYTLQIFVDHCSVEIFANDGLVTVTELIFPDRAQTSLTLYSTGGTAKAALQLTDLGKEKA